jgi:hypothetical protein
MAAVTAPAAVLSGAAAAAVAAAQGAVAAARMGTVLHSETVRLATAAAGTDTGGAPAYALEEAGGMQRATVRERTGLEDSVVLMRGGAGGREADSAVAAAVVWAAGQAGAEQRAGDGQRRAPAHPGMQCLPPYLLSLGLSDLVPL